MAGAHFNIPADCDSITPWNKNIAYTLDFNIMAFHSFTNSKSYTHT